LWEILTSLIQRMTFSNLIYGRHYSHRKWSFFSTSIQALFILYIRFMRKFKRWLLRATSMNKSWLYSHRRIRIYATLNDVYRITALWMVYFNSRLTLENAKKKVHVFLMLLLQLMTHAHTQGERKLASMSIAFSS